MAKKPKRRLIQESIVKPDEIEILDETELLFKKVLKTMSWIVGICFILIIILPMFENKDLDNITKILYYIGIINLLAFTILEFAGNSFKQFLQKHFISAQ